MTKETLYLCGVVAFKIMFGLLTLLALVGGGWIILANLMAPKLIFAGLTLFLIGCGMLYFSIQDIFQRAP